MSLINCPECEKIVSDKAANCPNCGCPIRAVTIELNISIVTDDYKCQSESETESEFVNKTKTEDASSSWVTNDYQWQYVAGEDEFVQKKTDSEKEPAKEEAITDELNTVVTEDDKILYPNLPKDLNVGKQIVSWSGDASVSGIYDFKENAIKNIPKGPIVVLLHTHGIEVCRGFTRFPIHNSQLINMECVSKENLIRTNKLAKDTSRKNIDKYYLVIKYWDIHIKVAQILLMSGKKTKIDKFITRYLKQKYIYETEYRPAGRNTTLMWGVINLIALALALSTIIIAVVCLV